MDLLGSILSSMDAPPSTENKKAKGKLPFTSCRVLLLHTVTNRALFVNLLWHEFSFAPKRNVLCLNNVTVN